MIDYDSFLLCHLADITHCGKHVVYKIPCLDCTGVYIGETGRSFKTRPKEHQRDVKPDIIAQLANEDI